MNEGPARANRQNFRERFTLLSEDYKQGFSLFFIRIPNVSGELFYRCDNLPPMSLDKHKLSS